MGTVDFLWERHLLSLPEYQRGKNLSCATRSMISDPHDLWRISLIDNVILPHQKRLATSLLCKHFADLTYARHKEVWDMEERYLLGLRLDHSPTLHELSVDRASQHHSDRFHLWYSLTWPQHMHLGSPLESLQHDVAYAFFTRADELHPEGRYISHYFGPSPEKAPDYSTVIVPFPSPSSQDHAA